CERILRKEFGHEFFQSFVNANRLEFPFVRKAEEGFDAPVGDERFRCQLLCDFLTLTYLFKNEANAKRRFSNEVRLLSMYFRAVLLTLGIRHALRLSEGSAVLKLTSVLEYLANVLGETPLKVVQREPRLRTHANWRLASFVGIGCILFAAVLGPFPL